MYTKVERLIETVQSHSRVTVAIIITVTLALGFTAFTSLEFSADYSDMIPDSNNLFEIEGKSEEAFPSDYIVMVTSSELFSVPVLESIHTALLAMAEHPDVGEISSVFDYSTIEKKGARLVTVPLLPETKDNVWTRERAEIFEKRTMNDDIVSGLFVSDDMESLIFSFKVRHNEPALLADFEQIFEPVKALAHISSIGEITITNRIMEYLSYDLITLLSLSFAVILGVYFISFRAKRASFIPFSLSVVGIIWTLGVMALLGFRLTVVNIVTPVLVLTIGSSYSIHVLTEYFQSYHEGDVNYIQSSVAKIGRTIMLACITDIVGFLSLLTARTDAFKEFGITVSIGITFCALLSVTYLPAVLAITSAPRTHHMRHFRHGFISRISKGLSRLVIRRWPVYLIIALGIFIGFLLTRNSIGLQTNYMNYFPRKEPLIINSLAITQEFKGIHNHYITLQAPEGEEGYFLRPEVLAQTYRFEQALEAETEDISKIMSYAQYVAFMNRVYTGTREIPSSTGLIHLLNRFMIILSQDSSTEEAFRLLISEDGNQITITLRAWDSSEGDLQTVASAKRLNEIIHSKASLLSEGVDMTIWGDGTDAILFSDSIREDQRRATTVSFILVFLISVFSFRSLLFGLYSIIPIIVGIMANYVFMFFTHIPFDIITITFTSVIIGVGIDDAIHFLIRYKQKVASSGHSRTVLHLRATIHETARPILLTTAAIVLGISMLAFGSYVPIRYFGILVSVSLLATMASTLIILPPVILVVEKIRGFLTRR